MSDLDSLRDLLPAAVQARRRVLILGLVAAGWSRYRIGKELGVSTQTVLYWERKGDLDA